jgi:restriction endonuclease S subunit
VDHLTQWRYDESPEIQLAAGDVLLVKDGSTLGMSAFVRTLPAPATVNGSIAVIRPSPSLAGSFLFYSINGQNFQRLIWLKRAGLGVPHLFQADLREFKIPLPALAEQNRIAEILSTLDETIAQTEAQIAKYQQIKAGLMQDLFTRGVTPDGRLRPSRAQAPQLYKESLRGWPKEWGDSTCGDEFDLSSGITLGPHRRPGRNSHPYPMGGRINVVETPDTLLFTNLGSFLPGTVEEMIRSDALPEIYRNPFLAQAMVNLNMIDTIGSGIKRMFTPRSCRGADEFRAAVHCPPWRSPHPR